MFKKIMSKNKTLAIIISKDYSNDVTEFFTSNDFPLQISFMNRPIKECIQAHIHNKIPREISITSEVLIIRKGKLRVDLYDDDKTYVVSQVISEGDVLMVIDGGHGFEMLEEVEMLCIKQGPYLGVQDKERFVNTK